MGYFTEVILLPALITFVYFYGKDVISDPAPSPYHDSLPQTKLTNPGPLLNENYSLHEAGYMSAPLKDFNISHLLTWQLLRIKQWDYYDVITDEMAVSFALVDLYFGGEVRINYFNFNTRETKAYRKLILPTNVPKLSVTSYKFTDESPDDNVKYEDGDFHFEITNLGGKHLAKHNTKKVFASCSPIDLKLEFTLSLPTDQEIMAAVIPLDDTQEYFFYSLKIANGITEGSLKLGDKVHQINKKNSGGFIDWSRAVWPYNSYWTFARAQGFLADGKKFSLNFGGGYGHNETSKATEDAFFIDNKMYKLDVVHPRFDDNNLMNPWEFKTKNGKDKRGCEIVFASHYVDAIAANYIVLQSNMRVVYGQYSGWVSDENGKKYIFENVNGYAEVFKTKW